MKKLITLLLLVSVMFINGQGKIGETYYKVRQTFNNPKYQLKEGVLKDKGVKFIVLDYKNAAIVHYFYNNTCMLTAVLPYSPESAKRYYDLYNKYCEVDLFDKNISWEYIDSRGNNIEIEFINDTDKYYFIWYNKNSKNTLKVTKL